MNRPGPRLLFSTNLNFDFVIVAPAIAFRRKIQRKFRIAHFSSLCYYHSVMLTNTQEKLISILRAELTGTDEADLSGLSDQELAAIYHLAKAHNLSSMAGDYMSRHSVMNKVILRDMAYAQSNVEHMDKVMTEVTKALTDARIPFLPLKGVQMRKLYPKPWMRLSGDIDFLIHKEDKESFTKALRDTLSYTYEPGIGEDHFTTSDDVLLDVSTTLHGPDSIDANGSLYSDIWDHAAPEKDDSTLYILSDAMRYTHAVIHMAKHLRHGGCGINHLMDLWVLNHRIPVDAEKKSARLALIKEKHLEKIAEELEKISEKWFSAAETPVDTELEEYILSGAAHGTQKAKVSVNRKGLSKARYMLNRFFVPYNHLKILFPQIEGKRWLTPFYEVYRWIYHAKNGRTGIIMNEFKESDAMTDDLIELNTGIMDRYGL